MSRMTMDYTGSTVFVAGGTSGINLGIAEGFAAAGARVAVMSRSQDKVDAAVRRLRDIGAESIGVAADVRDVEATGGALAAAHDAFGDIDVLVSGAAGNFPATALGMSPNAFRSVLEIDLLGTLPRAARRVRVPPQTRLGGDQHFGAASVSAMGVAISCLRGQSGCGHADPGAGHRMGRGRCPRQRGGPRPDRGDRGNGPAGTDTRRLRPR